MVIDRSQKHRTKDRSNQQRSTKPKLIDRSIIPTGYKDDPQHRLPPVGFANDQTSNTKIVGFLEVGNRSIIPTGYKDTPQQRSIEPQTLKLLGFSK